MGKNVAHSTQFESPFDRAINAREKVKSRLKQPYACLPIKPKWYERLAEKYHAQEDKIDQCMADFVG